MANHAMASHNQTSPSLTPDADRIASFEQAKVEQLPFAKAYRTKVKSHDMFNLAFQ